MVQLLVDHGADVNIPARGSMPLAAAEARGHMEVASILRRAGARVRADNEEFSMDPRIRLQIEPKISMLVVMARINFPTESPELIADKIEGKLNLEFPNNMPLREKERIRTDVRALILKECGAKDYLDSDMKIVPSPEEAMRKTGMSEDELTRRFMEHLIQQGKNPFENISQVFRFETELPLPMFWMRFENTDYVLPEFDSNRSGESYGSFILKLEPPIGSSTL